MYPPFTEQYICIVCDAESCKFTHEYCLGAQGGAVSDKLLLPLSLSVSLSVSLSLSLSLSLYLSLSLNLTACYACTMHRKPIKPGKCMKNLWLVKQSLHGRQN
jgi:hypothetical protein